MENKGYLINEVGNLGGNDKGEIKFILFLMFLTNIIYYDTLKSKEAMCKRWRKEENENF